MKNLEKLTLLRELLDRVYVQGTMFDTYIGESELLNDTQYSDILESVDNVTDDMANLYQKIAQAIEEAVVYQKIAQFIFDSSK